VLVTLPNLGLNLVHTIKMWCSIMEAYTNMVEDSRGMLMVLLALLGPNWLTLNINSFSDQSLGNGRVMNWTA
jgi:hypothetical protein